MPCRVVATGRCPCQSRARSRAEKGRDVLQVFSASGRCLPLALLADAGQQVCSHDGVGDLRDRQLADVMNSMHMGSRIMALGLQPWGFLVHVSDVLFESASARHSEGCSDAFLEETGRVAGRQSVGHRVLFDPRLVRMSSFILSDLRNSQR